jgi:hypothetical protein
MSQTITIPQAVYDQYNACYNNQTYRAFSHTLATALGIDEPLTTYHEQHNRLMNLLTDTALELVGADVYLGSGKRLAELLATLEDYTPMVVQLAIAHLDQFAVGDKAWKTREHIAEIATLALTEYARRVLVRMLDHAALLPGWHGTAPYYWLLACSQILHAAEIILRDDPSADYLVEKFGKGIEMLARGTDEIVRYGNPHPAIQQFHEQLTVASQS